MTDPQKGYGYFGNLADSYVKGRKGYPDWVFELLRSKLPEGADWKVLDAACGTGISTRQLASHLGCHVVGIDHDPKMIEKAKADKSEKQTRYLCVSLTDERLPPHSFDAVTVFSAFHWFARDAASVNALVKVLKPGGYFLVANKNTTMEVVPKFRQLVDVWSNKVTPNAKEGLDPAAILSAAGLRVTTRKEEVVEHYTVEQAFELLLSKSLWNEVPPEKQPFAKQVLRRQLLDRALTNDDVRRNLELEVHLGKVP